MSSQLGDPIRIHSWRLRLFGVSLHWLPESMHSPSIMSRFFLQPCRCISSVYEYPMPMWVDWGAHTWHLFYCNTMYHLCIYIFYINAYKTWLDWRWFDKFNGTFVLIEVLLIQHRWLTCDCVDSSVLLPSRHFRVLPRVEHRLSWLEACALSTWEVCRHWNIAGFSTSPAFGRPWYSSNTSGATFLANCW